ncbi:outer membrane lipoprotein chaperone LolA [Candidatus Methylopumilus universalis]|uniref:Outer-membrane lipoprotein carrier protein n=1 Tax=Candidatus Methylopumilus universalis TaxID=2588536 RepID=A0AAX1EZ37_9PROT|nr:outer membrane lipoprotein chaperone LolA [Candidatus Methylopumilus universalis]QDC41033.1 outer membrane lipoprotein chaperone LolA [Candidatus Methylopumilus universalis]QDC42324.1 outer membrane lipoprotein chaperone LolA [Candidatus Methylopumilus universalis]QDC54710.1 outer membrane lipoprotein chaperone LolA [Candidatus Methylopumilus universalis]QDC55990.1 outer membrane lipoprotein chaperone LolA [Candidatus Methylopumilus universalis]QDC57273.1 outer membrane lipoprotein chaperon
MNKLFFVFLMLSLNVFAEGIPDLNAFVNNVSSMSSEFSQVVLDKKGSKLQDVEGVMLFKRPNKFRWDYLKPYQNQIISDGDRLYMYDQDLRQVSINSIAKVGSSTPLLIIAGKNIEKYFTLKNIESQAGDESSQNIKWVEAIPKEEGAGFSKVMLGLTENKLSVMKIVDAFEHITTISFRNAKYNVSLSDNDFLFKLPNGVDVVQNGGVPTNLPTTSSSNKNKDAELIAFANDWANAWSAKDIDLYLSKYAQDFKTPNGDAFSLWQASRRQKISSQGKILVEIEDLKLSMKTENSARIQFKQKYTSDRLTEMSNKSLVVKKIDGRWLIQEEISGK